MYILVDNSKDGELNFFYTLNTKWVQQVFRTEQSLDLLSALDDCLKKIGKKISDLRGLAVVVGKGRFTATRVAVTVANTLAYTLQIPVVAMKDPDTAQAVNMIESAPVGQYVSAKYSGEANIGKKKN